MIRTAPVPAPLTQDHVRGGHILFLFLVIWGATGIAGYKLAQSVDDDLRLIWNEAISHFAMAVLLAGLVIVVPELRRSLRFLYGSAHGPLSATDTVLFIGIMLAWAYGGHRLLVFYPLLRWRPEYMTAVGYFAEFPSVSPIYLLLWAVTVGLVSPFVEELLFRGFLLNLWRHRWGLWPGIVLSSLAFGVMHFQGIVFASVAGVMYALIYLRYRSLWPGTLLHGLYNLVSSPFLLGPLLLVKDPTKLGSLSAWIPEIALSAAFLALLPFFWRRFRPAT
jgi:membrane protease YdiL (CAAX protease family)